MPAPALSNAPGGAALLLLAALAACTHTVVDSADACTPARHVFREQAAQYLALANIAPVPVPSGAGVLLQHATRMFGDNGGDFDRLYAQTASLESLDEAAAAEIAARRAQVAELATAWQALAACRRTQAAEQPGGRATQPARLRHEEDLRELRLSAEATSHWRHRYQTLTRRIAEMSPGNATLPRLTAPQSATTFATTADTFATTTANARTEAATHFTPY